MIYDSSGQGIQFLVVLGFWAA